MGQYEAYARWEATQEEVGALREGEPTGGSPPLLVGYKKNICVIPPSFCHRIKKNLDFYRDIIDLIL